MGRARTGTVVFRGNPPRWHARLTVRDGIGRASRVWVDLERPDLQDTPEDKEVARQIARQSAVKASRLAAEVPDLRPAFREIEACINTAERYLARARVTLSEVRSAQNDWLRGKVEEQTRG
jgi:hypothetical protein